MIHDATLEDVQSPASRHPSGGGNGDGLARRHNGSSTPAPPTTSLKEFLVLLTNYVSHLAQQNLEQHHAILALQLDLENIRVRKDQEVAKSQKQLFGLGAIAHEMRSPLLAMVGLCDILRTTELDTWQRECVNTLVDGADMLRTSIHDLLDYSKLESGKFQLDEAPFALDEVLRRCVALHAHAARQKGIALSWKLHPGHPATVVGDAARFRQILTNLIANAIKFTSAGEVVVHVRGHAGPRTRTEMFEVEVRDTGTGIAPDAIDLIFEPFAHAHTTAPPEYVGTGLGLAIGRRLAGLMDGKLIATSQPHRGSSFILILPTHPQDPLV